MFYPRDIYCIMLYCFSLSYSFCLSYCIKRFSLLTAMMSNKLLGLGLGLQLHVIAVRRC